MISTNVYIAIIAMGGLGFFFAAFLAVADKKLRVVEDPMVEKLDDALPGTNCGACGYPGCNQVALKLADGSVPIDACPAGGQEVVDLIAQILGVESVKAEKVIAVVLCRGGEAEALKDASYRGERSCVAANITGGEKACIYGCHGYADCVVSCSFGAMDMNDNGLPVVFVDKCVGCGACVTACPKNLIELHPPEDKLFVYCKNRDKGPVAKKACKTACIGCTLCVKLAGAEGAIAMKNNLAIIDYEVCPQTDSSTVKCPTKCILFDEEKLFTKEAFYAAKIKDSA